MSDRRPFPPSPRRIALARASGLSAASPILVGAIAASAGALALFELGKSATMRLGAWISHACSAAGTMSGATLGGAAGAATGATLGSSAGAATAAAHTGLASATAGAAHTGLASATAGAAQSGLAGATHGHLAGASPLEMLGRVPRAVLEVALPLLAAIAIAAMIAHVVQTRAVWFPRRRLPGTPSVPRRSRIGFELVAAATIGATCVGWLWMTAPRLAHLVEVPSAAPIAVLALLVTLATAWVALGALDALLRRRDLDEALAMTHEEKREDDRLSAADPRWAAHRRTLARAGTGLAGSLLGGLAGGADLAVAVARSAVVLVGEDRSVAIAWNAMRQPVPLRVASGRGPRAAQLVALARRHRVRVHLDEGLARALADGEGPIPEAHCARLAEIMAALHGR